VLHRLSIIDVAQRAGLTLDEIAPLTGPDNRTVDASRHIRALAEEKLPSIEALIARAQAVKHWLQVAQSCDCTSVDVCGSSSIPRCCHQPVTSTSTSARSGPAAAVEHAA
jgi:DNA-binding transcriptional MerR regulator